jgi:outer membrane protein, heavy metal efflux system
MRSWSASAGRAGPGKGLACGVVAMLLATGCVRYHPEPIAPARTLDDFEARRLDSPALGEFLETRDGITPWPPATWDLNTLTLAAFYYNPDLDVARAQWGVARGGVMTAGGRPNPSLSAALGYNASTPAGDISPWIPEAILGLPIEVAGKRGIRIRQAGQLSEAARLDILTVAWQVRSRVRQGFVDFYVARQADSLLARQQEIQTSIVAILEAQLAVGEVSPFEVTQARIALADSRLARLAAAQQRAAARSELAAALGVSPAAVDSVGLFFEGLSLIAQELPGAEIRRQALVSRSDILGALAQYEASQAALQLEVRKQYPDLELGPGYQLDQTDNKWTLGLAVTLPFLNRNRGPIAEAAARREEAAARFLTVQSRALGEIEASISAARAGSAQVAAADSLLNDLTSRDRSAQAAYQVGQISRLELLGLQAEMVTTGLSRLGALAGAQQAIGRLEDAMQSTLDVGKWVLDAPRRNAGKDEPHE